MTANSSLLSGSSSAARGSQPMRFPRLVEGRSLERRRQERPIGVSLVDADDVFRRSLRILIDDSAGFVCLADYHDMEAALAAVEDNLSNLWLLDVELPGMSGPEGVSALLMHRPEADVVMFTAHADEDQVLSSLCSGASGYLLKDTPPARLLPALREAASGGAVMSSQVARKVIQRLRKLVPRPSADHDLTTREVGLLGLLAEGHSYQGVADRLFISINTVRSHVRNLYDKLNVHSRSQAVHKALAGGIL